MTERKSEAEIPPLIDDPIELAEAEAANALEQFDWAMSEVQRWLSAEAPVLKVSMLLRLHRTAMEGIDRYAGNFRPASVEIKGSGHKPISIDDVPRYVEEMLEYITDNWETKSAIHLSSYAMWRLNWIHPFADGNGRTSRILSYMVLCGHLGQILPGIKTIPEQISENKKPYYDALEDADKKFKKGSIDTSAMEQLIEKSLGNQLAHMYDKAKGETPQVVADTRQTKQPNMLKAIEAHPAIFGGIMLIIVTLLGIIFG